MLQVIVLLGKKKISILVTNMNFDLFEFTYIRGQIYNVYLSKNKCVCVFYETFIYSRS